MFLWALESNSCTSCANPTFSLIIDTYINDWKLQMMINLCYDENDYDFHLSQKDSDVTLTVSDPFQIFVIVLNDYFLLYSRSPAFCCSVIYSGNFFTSLLNTFILFQWWKLVMNKNDYIHIKPKGFWIRFNAIELSSWIFWRFHCYFSFQTGVSSPSLVWFWYTQG